MFLISAIKIFISYVKNYFLKSLKINTFKRTNFMQSYLQMTLKNLT